MDRSIVRFSVVMLLALSGATTLAQPVEHRRPISLHPDNPHYFLFRGKPTVLVTSGEHYGAVMNLDFDYVPYLDVLEALGFNQTRTFSGIYREAQGAFGVAEDRAMFGHQMIPGPGRYVCPWARSDAPGAVDGGMKFDLTKWDPEYFERLKDFVREAGKRDIVVEFVLFCTLYNDEIWEVCPLNPRNNVNDLGDVPRLEVWSLKHLQFVEIQKQVARKLVQELNEFDNVYFEITNEPYERKVPRDWEHHMVDTIVSAEASFPQEHLIAMNVGNGLMRVTDPHQEVSVLNFHYANPPDAVRAHWHLDRPIGFDETGGRGNEALPYRTDAWSFLLAGGAVYSNLDYSFTVDSPIGRNSRLPEHSGGGVETRTQLAVLKRFLEGFDFIAMKPDASVVRGGVPVGAAVQALVDPGRAYAVYLHVGQSSSLRWTGALLPPKSEQYTFYLASNDGSRLFLDGQLLIDNWQDYVGSDNDTERSATATLTADKLTELTVEYYDRGGHSSCRLEWSSDSRPRQIVPRSVLRTPDRRTEGLQADYFSGSDFDVFRMTQTEPTIDFEREDGSLTLFPELLSDQIVDLTLDLPAGSYSADWINTKTGRLERVIEFQHEGGKRVLSSPPFIVDVALRIRAARARRE